jgi:hypothetical protein
MTQNTQSIKLDQGLFAYTCISFLLQHLVEVLFVICTLCGGKKKKEVQSMLFHLGLLNALNDMFDLLDWFSSPPASPPESHGIHGPGCACNPKSVISTSTPPYNDYSPQTYHHTFLIFSFLGRELFLPVRMIRYLFHHSHHCHDCNRNC